MKAKLTKGCGFGGALKYALHEGKHAEVVGGNMSGGNAQALSMEFGAIRQLRHDIKKPVLHISLSCPAGEKLTGKQWEQSARHVLKKLGFGDENPYVVIRHGDTDHDHVLNCTQI